jgi:hypothetical protein
MIVLNANCWYSPATRQDERLNNLRDIAQRRSKSAV